MEETAGVVLIRRTRGARCTRIFFSACVYRVLNVKSSALYFAVRRDTGPCAELRFWSFWEAVPVPSSPSPVPSVCRYGQQHYYYQECLHVCKLLQLRWCVLFVVLIDTDEDQVPKGIHYVRYIRGDVHYLFFSSKALPTIGPSTLPPNLALHQAHHTAYVRGP